MDIKILHSWLLEYLETDASPQKIGQSLALCGPSCERVTKLDNDWIYEIEVTTNRVDMMSIYGIAREAAAILPQFGFKTKLKPLKLKTFNFSGTSLPLKIKTDSKLTHRVMAVILDNVKINKSPDFIQKRLASTEIRSLNNVIDITNYVMTEIGHPCHVFDYDKIKSHKLNFRLSQKGEKITTLDNKTYTLPGNDIVIDDGTGTIIDLPGIMGTKNSVVDENTKRIIFFIDNNNAKLMRQTSMNLGIRTVAVTLNEKRVDPELGEKAVLKAVELYQKHAHTQVASQIYDFYLNPSQQKTLSISLAFIESKLGVKLDSAKTIHALKTLGFDVKINQENNKENYLITIPSWRNNDINIPEDIVEEVARIYGYHNLPSIIPTGDFPLPNPQENNFYWENVVKNCLKNWGYTENYNYSLISQSLIEKVGQNPQNFLKLKNPLNQDWVYLRTLIFPSLLQSLANNQDRVENINFFEMANIYLAQKDSLPLETMNLALINNSSNHYLKIKGILEALSYELGISLNFQKTSTHPFLAPNLQADILLEKQKIGFIGQISKDLFQNFSLKKDCSVAQINFDQIIPFCTKNKIYTPIPKFPPIIEDLTFFNNQNVESVKITQEALNTSPELIDNVSFSSYKNKITLQVTYLDKSKNLEAKNITPIRKKLVDRIENLGLKLQGQI